MSLRKRERENVGCNKEPESLDPCGRCLGRDASMAKNDEEGEQYMRGEGIGDRTGVVNKGKTF